MRTSIAIALLVLGGCATSKVAADKSKISTLAAQDLACGSDKAEVVYYGLRGEDVRESSPCFGERGEALAVVECGGKRRAYWRYADGNWEATPGTVTSVTESGVELTMGGSGAVQAVARCSR
jgi:hypothetical protein